MGSAGLPVDLRDTDNLDGMQQSINVPPELRGCHAGLIDGYVISGHVPPDDIKRLLAEKPEGAGLAVPGMPMGSPGMDVDGAGEAFDVVLFGKDGSSRVFQSHS